MNRIISGTWLKTKSYVCPMSLHIIKFLATVFIIIWFWLHSYIVENELGIVIRSLSSLLLLFKYINDIASNAEGAVTCKFTLFPSLILDVLFSFMWYVEVMLWGGSIALPPSINLISLSSICKSLNTYFLSLIPKQTIPKAHPAAKEYPSLSMHLSDLGNLPICDKVVSVIVRLQVPLCNNPNPINALVCTFMGIYTSIEGGNNAGMCKNNALVND